MTHLADNELRGLAHPTGHLGACTACRLRWESWRRLTAATRQAAAALAPPDRMPPAFDALLLAIDPVTERPGPAPSWRITVILVLRQIRLMPRLLMPLSVVGLAAAVAIALVTPGTALASRYFAAAVVLVVLLGSLATCTRRADPRTELLCALPISPVAVFTARLVLVLATDLLFALTGSAVVHAAGVGTGVVDVVTSWLGQSLLASAIAVLGAVRYTTGVGAAAAVATWYLGSFTTFSSGGFAEHVGAVAAQIWGTTPWTAAVALALFVLAVRQVRLRPESRRELA